MADVKISGLPASTTPLAGTEVLPIVQGGQTRQVSVANLTAGRAVSATNLTLTGVATVPAGTVGAPSITTTGDTNTGVFFPAADTIAFSEGGVEAMRIHSSSGVSIGNTTDPGATNLSVTGKATIQTLSVGKGNSSVATNTALGYNALNANTTGAESTAAGYIALQANQGGTRNTAFGSQTLLSNVSGNDGAAFGRNALAVTTGSQNSAFGSSAGSNITSGSNLTCIGYNATASSATATNEVTLGNSSVATLRCQVTSITGISDARDKKDVQIIEAGLDFVNKLRPVKFTWNMRDGGTVDVEDTGFIAQDLQQVQIDTGITIPNLVVDNNPEKIEATYGKLIPVLVKAIQDLSAKVTSLEAQIGVK